MGERKKVERDDIDAIVCASSTSMAWDLTDAIGKRDIDSALKVLRQLLFQRENPVGLVMAIHHLMRNLLIYREALENKWLIIGSGNSNAKWVGVPPEMDEHYAKSYLRDPRKMHPYRLGILAAQASNYKLRELRRCQKEVMEAHEQMVSSSVPQEIILELLLMRMMRR
jgi:DNA polymerase-3 subunit delta